MASSSGSAGRKTISLLTATCLVIANMVGTGIFTSLGFQVGDLPSGFAILLLWLTGGVCAFCGASAYSELAAALPRSGGEYHFLSKIYHPSVGFVAGWISATVGFAAPIALAAMAFGHYFADICAFPPPLVSLIVVLLVTLVHLGGIGLGSVFQNSATLFKVLLIVVFIIAGGLLTHPQAIHFLPAPGDARLIASHPFATSLVYVMYAYSGWNAAAYVGGEIQKPERNIPLALGSGTLAVTVLYLALNATFLRAAPLADLRGKLDVGHVAAAFIFGPAGGRIMAGLICIGLISSISAMTWVGPRVAMTMGEDFTPLRWLAWRNKLGVPAVAIGFQFALVVFLVLNNSFERVLTYVQFSLTLCSFLTVLGVFILRRTQPDLLRPYRTWGYPLTPAIFLAISGWMLVNILQSNPRESLAGLATSLLGLLIYFFTPRARVNAIL